MNTIVTGKGVVDTSVAVDGDARMSGERLDDFRLRFFGDELVLFSDMKHGRGRDLWRLMQKFIEADAVIAHVTVGVGTACHEIDELAAQTEAHRANAPGAAFDIAQILE